MRTLVLLSVAVLLSACEPTTPSGPGAEVPHTYEQDRTQCASEPDLPWCPEKETDQ